MKRWKERLMREWGGGKGKGNREGVIEQVKGKQGDEVCSLRNHRH